jgi:hypothetical protein
LLQNYFFTAEKLVLLKSSIFLQPAMTCTRATNFILLPIMIN